MLSAAASLGAEEAKAPFTFKMQEINKTLTVGYAVRIADLNGDGKPDIVVCDSARVIWFSNPDWTLHTIIENKEAGVKADNVSIAIHDIDGDNALDIALAADWLPGNTKGGGSLQWLQQPKNIDEPWRVHKIFDSEPTLHRIYFADLEGSGKKSLIVAPLKGKESTDKLGAEKGVRLLSLAIPTDPVKGPWEPHVLTDQFHVVHNILPVPWGMGKGEQLLVSSFEGVSLLMKKPEGTVGVTHFGDGDQTTPTGSRGAGEVKAGLLKDGRLIVATVEPFHGTMAAVYVSSGKTWTRQVLDSTLTGGHAIACADLNGDGTDEIIVGWRDVIAGKPPTGVRIFHATDLGDSKAPAAASKLPAWEMMQLEKGGVACEDLVCADLNGDGKIDIVTVGRFTKNVRIYWNQTPSVKK